MGISEKIKRMGLSKAYDYLDKDPDANIPKLLDWVDKLDRNDSLASQRKVFPKWWTIRTTTGTG